MTMTQQTTTTKTPAARPRRPRKASSSDAGGGSPRIGRPTRYEGEKEKKLLSLTTDAISIADQIAAREGCSFSNAVEKAIRAAGAAANIHPIAKVRV